jgi:Tfp pilus assembly protein PilN
LRAVNLLPQDQRRRAPSESTGKGAYAVVGLLAVLLVMAVVYVLTSNQVTERQSRVAVVKAEANRLEALAAQRNSFADFARIAQTRLVSVAGVAETRFDWERLMRELSRIMPEGSWLQSTDASILGDPAAEGAPTSTSTTPTAVPVGPTATLEGCTPEQSDVAQMMVRLRQVHRVSEVTLNESAQAQAPGTPASVDDCGSLYKYDLTLSFEATAPVAEAPRGATRVPAFLGGGS